MAGRRDSETSFVGNATVVTQSPNGNGSRNDTPNGATAEPDVGELELVVMRLERANAALQRENARLAGAAHGQTDTAAAVCVARVERHWRERAEAAELEAQHLARLLGTPRHQAVERARESVRRSRLLYPVVQRIWAWVARG